MKLEKVVLKNFRNFADAEITLNSKSLIIGANDVGKTNLIDAIRILLDKNLSENDLEPADEDFCAFNNCDTFEILLYFAEIDEDCIYAKLGQYIDDDNNSMFLSYYATRDIEKGVRDYTIKAGPSLELLEELQGRHYLKVLNMKYIKASRNVDNFLKSEKNKLLEALKSNRTAERITRDNEKLGKVVQLMNNVQSEIDSLSYIQSAGTRVSDELNNLAEHHISQEIKLGIDIPKNNDLFKKVQLLSYVNEQSIQVGGEGRKNQAFIALWSAMNQLQYSEDQLDEVSIFCIEEPEAHLHPHQQRKLSEYLVHDIDTQVLLTTHAPSIATDFNPTSIVRLYTSLDKSTVAAKGGTSDEVAEKIKKLEFRLNVISSEVYFSDCVLLVEGSSEVIFYKALAQQLGIDLDKLNISILSVEGVGFKRYIELFEILDIPWFVRTDNDYFKVTRKKKEPKVVYRLAGIQRALDFAHLRKELNREVDLSHLEQIIQATERHLTGIPTPTEEHRESMYKQYYDELVSHNIYLAKIGLEEDLYNASAEVSENIREYFEMEDEEYEDEEVIEAMKKKKSTFMFHFVQNYIECLSYIKDVQLTDPLYKCKEKIEGLRRV
ncbi:ATP-dependent nuclease [Salinicoccus luteus]|uniref:ATP-dependent nuclease n=1 Tax=Salinicoccus luteus TaxID=367840 RepID=UPI0004E0BA10|nr:AAA family ATPase [Salinicoccus luteus]